MNHPSVDRTERTGYPVPIRNPRPILYNACECGLWEAVVRFNGQKLCEDCAREERIEIL